MVADDGGVAVDAVDDDGADVDAVAGVAVWTVDGVAATGVAVCCDDDDASLSSVSFLKSLIAQHPFCKMILIKLFSQKIFS